MTAPTQPVCDDCGEPGFVATPGAVVLCAVCFARLWRAAARRAAE